MSGTRKRPPRKARSVSIALVAGIALLAVVGAITLTRSPPRVARVGEPGGDAVTRTLARGAIDFAVCQPGEALPAGVSGIRLALWAFYGANVHVRVYKGSRVLTEGSRGADWTSDSVTVPVEPLERSSSGVTLCFGIGPNSQPISVLGVAAPPTSAASVDTVSDEPDPSVVLGEHELVPGRVGVEYLAAGTGSWWSRILTVARHMGLGRSYAGTWIALLVAALMAAVGVLAIRLTWRELP
jgi:hypothetical protein